MATPITANQIGQFDFGIVSFNFEHVAQVLQRFIDVGSTKGSIAITDLHIVSRAAVTNNKFTTISHAISSGTRLFDAIAYFSLPEDRRPAVTVEVLENNEEDPTIMAIGRSIFYVWFLYLTRANIPSVDDDGATFQVPRLLSHVMGLNDGPKKYIQNIASFDLVKMDARWIRFVTIVNIGQEVSNRLGLGVAGYRILSAIFADEHKYQQGHGLDVPLSGLRKLYRLGPVWDVHPITRSANFLNIVKNFNANLNNMLLILYDDAYLTQLKDLKFIFDKPIYNPRFNEFRSWDATTFDGFTDKVFP